MDKKKILFILGVLDSGGVAKSLVSLLNAIDTDKYDVSLLLKSAYRGPFFDSIPKGVRVIQDEVMTNVGSTSGVWWLLFHGHLLLALGTVLRLFVACISKPWSAYILSRLMPKVEGEYNLIVDYNGQQQTYYMVDKLQGKRKAAFFHSDYAKWPYYYKMDKKYYPKLDAIFSISPICVDSLKNYFPEQADKILLFENISSPKLINQLASQPLPIERTHRYALCTLGHVWKNKGSDTAIEVAKRLKDGGVDFEWWFVGTLGDDLPYQDIVRQYGLEGMVKFVGIQKNPYTFLRHADVVVHLSLFEGKSIALDEAKILCKPIVVTNFSSVGDQFTDGVNGLICKIGDVDGITAKIKLLLSDVLLREKLSLQLKANIEDHTNEIEKLYRLL